MGHLDKMEVHLPLRSALIFLEATTHKLQSAAYRLTHKAKPHDKALPGEVDTVVSQIYRACHHLRKASKQLHGRWLRVIGVDFSEPAPDEFEFEKYLPKLEYVPVTKDDVDETIAALKLAEESLPGGKVGKALREARSALMDSIERAERKAP